MPGTPVSLGPWAGGMNNVGEDSTINDRLVEQICVEVGGPCVYTGRTMAESHASLAVTEADFNALVEDLVDAMDARGIPRRAQNRLLRRLAPMHRDIVSP